MRETMSIRAPIVGALATLLMLGATNAAYANDYQRDGCKSVTINTPDGVLVDMTCDEWSENGAPDPGPGSGPIDDGSSGNSATPATPSSATTPTASQPVTAIPVDKPASAPTSTTCSGAQSAQIVSCQDRSDYVCGAAGRASLEAAVACKIAFRHACIREGQRVLEDCQAGRETPWWAW
jgi:hypothetical protein